MNVDDIKNVKAMMRKIHHHDQTQDLNKKMQHLCSHIQRHSLLSIDETNLSASWSQRTGSNTLSMKGKKEVIGGGGTTALHLK